MMLARSTISISAAALMASVQPGPLDEDGWSLLVANAAVAAKLRHLLPRLEADAEALQADLDARLWPRLRRVFARFNAADCRHLGGVGDGDVDDRLRMVLEQRHRGEDATPVDETVEAQSRRVAELPCEVARREAGESGHLRHRGGDA